MTTKNDYGRPEFVAKLSEWRSEIFFYPDAEIYSFQVLWIDFPKLPLKMAINIKLFKETIIRTLALLIFDRNLIPMLFPVITRIFSIFVSQTCGSLWPGRKSLRQKNLIKIAKRSTSSIENCSHSEMNGRLIAPGFVFPRVQCSAPYAQKEGRKMNSRRKTAAKHSSSSSSSSSGILLLMDV